MGHNTSFELNKKGVETFVWYAFRRDGSLEAVVRSVRPVKLLAVRGSTVLALRYDNDGIAIPEVYTLRR